jgi:hypothetical protein
MDVAKGDQDTAYVPMVAHVCCKHLFLMFDLVSDIYYKRVYLDVA